MNASLLCQVKDSWKIDDDLLGDLDRFIRSSRLVTQRDADKTWVRVWPGLAFCAHANRMLLPVGTSLRNPLRPEQVWSAFVRLMDKESDHFPTLRNLKPRPRAVNDAGLPHHGNSLWDKKAGVLYDTTGDQHAQAEAILFKHLRTSLQELNRRIVLELGIESWAEPVEDLLRRLGLGSIDLKVDGHDSLVSTISGQWDQIAPYVDAAMGSTPRTSGPAMLYLIAMCSACAERLDQQGGSPSLPCSPNWAGTMLDRSEPAPHTRLLRAISETGHKKSVVRIAARLGGQCIRILAENGDPRLAFQKCIEDLRRLGTMGAVVDPAFLAILDTTQPRWRTWPNKVLRLAVSQATETRGTHAYETLLMKELPCMADALDNHEINLDHLPKNARWPSLLSNIHLNWESALPVYCDSGYEVRPLLSTVALQEEGKKMKNCVGSFNQYDSLCAAGIFQVFSIRESRTLKCVATALIMLGTPKWRLTDVKGPWNQPVAPLILDIANRIASFCALNEKTQATLETHTRE
jgi:hypothetical protein